MINKLCIWLVRKSYQDIEYLRWVRWYIEFLLLKQFINLEDGDQVKIVTENKLLAHVAMLSYIVDYYQRESPKFRGIGRNYTKEYFEATFVDAIQFLRKAGEVHLKDDLQSLAQEYSDVSPEIDYSLSRIMGRLNEVIRTVNLHKSASYPLFA